jgi:hypothetical protein
LRKQAARRRKKLHQDHAYAAHLLNWQPFDLPKPIISNRASKISKPNPWRNFKLNRALYRREVTPKL